MKIFAAGIVTETNMFSPIPTSLEDFVVQRRSDVRGGCGGSRVFDLPGVWGKAAAVRGDEFIFSLMAFAQPAGLTVKTAYESLRDEILDDLRAVPAVDIVLLMLHGAMVSHGYEDCEEDLIRRVRDVVGSHTVIGVELDLHCHLSAVKIAHADVVITYKEYPHTDVYDRARELFNISVATKLGTIRPTMALFDCRMIGIYPTSRAPLGSFVNAMWDAEQRPGVLSVSFGHGFQFADLPHVGAKMLVVTDKDPRLAEQVARELGLQAYALRKEIGFDTISLPMDDALTKALASTRRPVVVADQSDNAGGGAPGDATYALRWLLEHRAQDVAMAIFYDPGAVKLARKAGQGATLPMRLGGKMGPFSGEPVDMEVTITGLVNNYIHTFPQQSGKSVAFALGNVAALRFGTIHLVVCSERCQCYSPSIFTDLGIDLNSKQLLVVKSAQHFYGAFRPIASEVIYMAGPGAVPPDPRQIAYRRLATDNLYPWHENPLEWRLHVCTY